MESDEAGARTKSLLFTLRLWSADENTHAPQWRVRLQNVHTGEVHYCGDGKSLTTLLDDILNEVLKEKRKEER
ncbi:MAG TPA: hypothetical protein PLQ75_07995 [Anaerolineales bacterium]|nr:hypothetical protein [Anaerolineales bacterium]